MYKKFSLGLLVAALFLFARPAAAMTATELQMQINLILAQIAVLQEQIALLQINPTSSVTVHIKNDIYNQSSDGRSAQVITSIGPSSDNSEVTSWGLTISCPSGVSVIIPPKDSSSLPKNICGMTQKYYTSDYPAIDEGVVVLSTVATNKNDYDVVIGYALVAYNANGKSIGGDKDGVNLSWEGDDDGEYSIDFLTPDNTGESYGVGEVIPVKFAVYTPDNKPSIAIRIYKRTGDKELLMNEVFYPFEDGYISEGKDSIDFYPAKGSSYPLSAFVGTFRLEIVVGEIMCCKYWIEEEDSDMTGWFTISSGPTATPSIKVISPNGGETYKTGDVMRIKWSAVNTPSGYVAHIGLRNTQTGIYADTPTQGYCNLPGGCVPLTTGFLDYTVPAKVPTGSYKIVIHCWQMNSEGSDCSASDSSDASFTISNGTTATPSIKVISPNGGETWYVGSTQKITWSSANLAQKEVHIRLLSECNDLTYLTTTPDDGSYTWTIPSSAASDKCGQKIHIATDEKSMAYTFDESDKLFSIPSQTVPYYGSVLGAGASYDAVLSQMADILHGMQEVLGEME